MKFRNTPFKGHRLRRTWLVLGTVTALVLALALPGLANLGGSPFDAGDGNLVLNDETQDWANAPHLQKGIDKPTGQNDDSFGQGTKEDTAVPTVVSGSIPNNKSDLLRFYVANDKVGGKEFLYLAWERVQEPNGTTNMDFEFNQDATKSANGVTPIRTAGDVLIKYDLAQGGTHPTLGYHLWVTSGNPATVCQANNSVPCWGKVQSLSGNFEGAINDPSNNPPTGEVVDPIPPDNPRTLSPRTFGEAAINLTDSNIIPPGSCKAFGAAYLKSRSSDSFTAALKDFIAPVPVSISNCGQVIIHKATVPSPDPTDTTFSYTTTGGLDPATFGLKDGGTQDYGDTVQEGSYSVTESDPGTNFVLSDLDCSASDLSHGSSVTPNLGTRTVSFTLVSEDRIECTFTNTLQQGAIKITKMTKNANLGPGDHPHSGVKFSISGPSGTFEVTTDSNGVACKDQLEFGNYTVTETVPSGYQADSQNPQTVGVSVNATCGSGNEATASFHNTPLSSITVSFTSKAGPGVTQATIECTGDSDPEPLPEGSPRTLDDLVPGTYTCEVVVDPLRTSHREHCTEGGPDQPAPFQMCRGWGQ
jgi:hypothetical protein